MVQKFDLFINGRWVEPRSKTYLPDHSPWNGELIAEVASANKEDINDAVLAAEKAQKIWSKVPSIEKERILLKAASIMENARDSYAAFLSEESGSVIGKAQFEVGNTISYFKTAAGECRRVDGDILTSGKNNNLSMVIHQPRGVVAAIGPYNFPLLLLACKVAFAVAAGNGVVVKSSSDTPVMAYQIAELFTKAGAPDGLVNAVSGSGSQIGDFMVQHPKVAMVTFTGSTDVGRHINQKGSEAFKKISLEMGGKSSMIVLKDVDVEAAAATAAFGIFFHQGQVCMANSRVIVESEIFDRFVEKMKAAAENMTIGSADNRNADIGPIITKRQIEKVDEHVKDALAKGAVLITGAKSDGQFYYPTILTNVDKSMKLYYEETFGPVVAVYKVNSLDDAIKLANDSNYGLSGAVMTNDINKALKAAMQMETGMVHINDSAIYGDEMAPFGGIKESGTGHEGGKYSTEEFTEKKWITININN